MTEELRGGPWIKGAFLCETILEGKDGVNSYVRVIDQITAEARLILAGTPPPGVEPPVMPDRLPDQTMIATNLVVMFATGGAQGRQELQLRLRRPDGLTNPISGPTDVFFDGRQNSAVNLHAALNLVVTQEGPYSIEVLLEGTRRTEVPFEIRYQRGPISQIRPRQ